MYVPYSTTIQIIKVFIMITVESLNTQVYYFIGKWFLGVVKYKASPSILMSIYFKRDVTPIGEGDVK